MKENESAGPLLTILSDLDNKDSLILQQIIVERFRGIGENSIDWRSATSEKAVYWDLGFFRGKIPEWVERGARDLREMLDRVFPLHETDFFLPAADFTNEDDQLAVLPILYFPDFVYLGGTSELQQASLTPESFERFLKKRGKIGLPPGKRGDWYAETFEIPADQRVSVETAEDFLNRGLSVAIHDRSWVSQRFDLRDRICSLAELGLDHGIPAWNCRMMISSDCENLSLAENILQLLISEKPETLLALEDAAGFPVRRSVFSSPRVQGLLIGIPPEVAESTVSNLVIPEKVARGSQ